MNPLSNLEIPFLPAPDIKSVSTSCNNTLATFNFPILVRVRDETGE